MKIIVGVVGVEVKLKQETLLESGMGNTNP